MIPETFDLVRITTKGKVVKQRQVVGGFESAKRAARRAANKTPGVKHGAMLNGRVVYTTVRDKNILD